MTLLFFYTHLFMHTRIASLCRGKIRVLLTRVLISQSKVLRFCLCILNRKMRKITLTDGVKATDNCQSDTYASGKSLYRTT